ncbi:MAG: zinc metallopeptidase [Clostridia bacterium]|nr:zinc metallopeptidase [Clostridia bacterium]
MGYGLGYGMYFDPTYVLVIFAFLLTMFASFGVKATFNRYDKIKSARGITGAMAARRILDANGLQHIRIERVGGNLTDHYSPKENVIRLSDATYNSDSVAAIGVAAHECGHAVQYKVGYAPIKIRNSIVPIVNIGNMFSMPLFIIGIILGMTRLAFAGAILFGLVLVFQLITLPVEINASRRAMQTLDSMAILESDELTGAKKTLTAAAMTYVASAAATALQLLRLLMIINNRRRD